LDRFLALEQLDVVDGGDANLQFVLGAGVRDDLPVVDALSEADGAEEVPEDVVVLLDVEGALVDGDVDDVDEPLVLLLGLEDVVYVPVEVRDDHADDLALVRDLDGVVEDAVLEVLVPAVEATAIYLALELLDLVVGGVPHAQLELLGLLLLLDQLEVLDLLLLGEVLLEEEEGLVTVGVLEHLLEAEHLVADVVAHLDLLVLVEELLAAAELEDHVALLVGALVLLAPLLVLLDVREEHKLLAKVAGDLQDLDELLQDVRAGPDAQLPGALVGAVLVPHADAVLAKQLAAVVALHRVDRDLQADAADQRVLQLLVHLPV